MEVQKRPFQENSPIFLRNMKNIQSSIISYIEDNENLEEKFAIISDQIDNYKFIDNIDEMKIIFQLIVNISNNCHRYSDFWEKIEQILKLFKNAICDNFTNEEIYDIFQSNKRILLFLMEENILAIDKKCCVKLFSQNSIKFKYPHYFSTEIRQFANEKWFNKNLLKKIKDFDFETIPDNFNELRKTGENESLICKLICDDSVDEFDDFLQSNNIPVNTKINASIYETNELLQRTNEISLIIFQC